MLIRGNTMGNKKNRLEKLDKTNESETEKIGDNDKLNDNTPKETLSNVTIEKVHFSRSYGVQYMQLNFSYKYVNVYYVLTLIIYF